jgi:hypothetical protein
LDIRWLQIPKFKMGKGNSIAVMTVCYISGGKVVLTSFFFSINLHYSTFVALLTPQAVQSAGPTIFTLPEHGFLQSLKSDPVL